MADIKKPQKRNVKRRSSNPIYKSALLSRKISIEFNLIGSNFVENIEKILKENYEGKCNKEGFIKYDSIELINYSVGVMDTQYVNYDIVFKCMVCNPVEGTKLKCKIINITKAGIRAIYGDDENSSPIIIFIARDHNYNNKLFNKLKINDIINTKIIGTRYELNDDKIHIISELISNKLNIKNK